MENGDKGQKRVVMIGIGGASCSGKTTLAKHLCKCFSNKPIILHQDDFAPPVEKVPVHKEFGIQDWDDAPGAIEWLRLQKVLAYVKREGKVPESHYSHDHLNIQVAVPVDEEVIQKWKTLFESIEKRYWEEQGVEIIWVVVDGFLLYWDKEVVKTLDIRVLVRAKEAVLKERREKRQSYYTAEGTLWKDPANYWENIVYPAYVRAHAHLFENGDVEEGSVSEAVEGLVLLESNEMSMQEMLERSCGQIQSHLS